jgi:hypothetical protein
MTKKIAIMQPYLFPYIGYWQLINASDEFVVYDDIMFKKNGWINRNNILLDNKKHIITLNLSKASSFKLINQINKNIEDKNTKQLLKTIHHAYKKAPYFNDIIPIIEETLLFPSEKIIELIYFSINKICEYLDISTKITLSSSLNKDNSLKGQDKVIHICKLLETTDYINAIGGLELYDKPSFANHNIVLHFLKTDYIEYKQFNNEFVPNLSIIDILMFNDVKKVKNYLKNFALI